MMNSIHFNDEQIESDEQILILVMNLVDKQHDVSVMTEYVLYS